MDARRNIPMGLRSAYRRMHRRTDAALAPLGVTADQFVLLALLSEEDGLTQRELARRASSDPNTVRAMLLLMEEKRLIERVVHPRDGRALRVNLTRAGRKQLESLSEVIRPFRDRLTALFTEEELKLFVGFLLRISEWIGEPGGQSDPE